MSSQPKPIWVSYVKRCRPYQEVFGLLQAIPAADRGNTRWPSTETPLAFLELRKTGCCSFSAVPSGGVSQLPALLAPRQEPGIRVLVPSFPDVLTSTRMARPRAHHPRWRSWMAQLAFRLLPPDIRQQLAAGLSRVQRRLQVRRQVSTRRSRTSTNAASDRSCRPTSSRASTMSNGMTSAHFFRKPATSSSSASPEKTVTYVTYSTACGTRVVSTLDDFLSLIMSST